MKAIVQKAFVDKLDKALCNVTDVVEITKKRFDEINKAGYGILLKEIKEKK